jgi:O-antigen/teichoic acid export membrane protein
MTQAGPDNLPPSAGFTPVAEFAIGGRSIQGHLRQGGAWSLGGKIGAGLSVFAVNLLLTRLLPPAEVGAYYLVFSLVAAVTILGQFGVSQVAIRRMGELLAQEDVPSAHRVARHAILIVSMTAVGGFVLLLALPLEGVLARLFPATPIGALVPLAAAWAALSLIQSVVSEVFRGMAEIRRAVITFDLVPTLSTALVLLALVLFARNVTLRDVLWISLIAVAANTAFALFGLSRRFRSWSWSTGELVALVRLGLPVWLATIAMVAATNAPLWIIGAFRSGEEIALFGVATKLANVAALPLLMVNGVLSPLIPQMFARGRREDLQVILQGTAALAAIPGILGLLFLVVFREHGLAWIFGAFYAKGLAVAFVLMIGQTINVLTGSCGLVLIMTGHERAASVLVLLFTSLAVTLAVVVAPRYGSLAVAAVMASAIALQNMFTMLYARRVAGLKTHAALNGRRILSMFDWRHGRAGGL